jgi:hypothetical protein
MRQKAAGFAWNETALASISRTMNYIVNAYTGCPFHTLQPGAGEENSSPGVSNTSTSEMFRR